MTRPKARPLAFALVLFAGAALTGCNVAGWAAHTVVGDGGHEVNVKAAYTGLDHQSVAVMVSAADTTLYQYPQARYNLCRAVSRQLADHVPGITLASPKKIIQFENNNTYWTAVPYGRLIDQLHVDRLLVIDLINYQTHNPGDTHVWRGLINATVGVASKSAKDPDNFVFYQHLNVQFPPDSDVGVVNSDNQTMQLGLNTLFASKAAHLFYTHKETEK